MSDEAVVDRAPGEFGDEEVSGLGRRLIRGGSALTLIALMGWGAHLLLTLEPRYLPVRVVSVEGEVRRLPLDLLQETVGSRLDGGILTQDLADLKAVIEELAWVHTAAVRRVWPDRLVISVYEHTPIARWGVEGLVTAAGVVFRPEGEELPHGLPLLSGSEDQAPLVTERFLSWRPGFEALGLSLVAVERDARGAWTLETDAGFSLALGKWETEQRVDRFLRAYPYIVEAGWPARVDMRYSNGLAVSWTGTRTAAGPKAPADSHLSSSAEPSGSDLRPSRS